MTDRKEGGKHDGAGHLTPFGETIRAIRKAKGLLLIDMARLAELSPGFLSLVETGKKPIPDRLINLIVSRLDLSSAMNKDLNDAAALSAREYRIRLEGAVEPIDRRIAHAMQTGLAKMSPTAKKKMLKLLEED